jgi:hypothetical protein
MSIYWNRYLVQKPGRINHYFSDFQEMLMWLDRGYEVWEGGPSVQENCGWVADRRLTIIKQRSASR